MNVIYDEFLIKYDARRISRYGTVTVKSYTDIYSENHLMDPHNPNNLKLPEVHNQRRILTMS